MQVDKISRDQVLKNSFWKLLESTAVPLLQVIVTVILARILSPNDYGMMAIVLVIINFINLFINSGIASYLVFIKTIRKQDFYTSMIINIGVSVVLLLAMVLFAGDIALYYSAPLLKPLIIALAVTLPFNAVSSIYNAYAMKMSMFRVLFVRNLIALPGSGFLALLLAYCGFGVWALVAQQISCSILLFLVIVLTIKITIDGEYKYEWNIIKSMIGYGGFTFLSSCIAFISDNISDLLIGKKINPQQLGYYNRGAQFPTLIVNIINSVLAGVLFPAFATYNTDYYELKEKCRKTIRLLYYAIFPVFFCMLVCAKPIVIITLSEKWLEAVPILQLFCLYYCFLPFLQTSSQVYLATGYVKLRMAGEIFKMASLLPLLFIFVRNGIIAVALCRTFVGFLLVIYTAIINKCILKYSFGELLGDILKPLLFGSCISFGLLIIGYLPFNIYIVSAIQLITGMLLSTTLVKIFRISEVDEIISLVLAKIRSKK